MAYGATTRPSPASPSTTAVEGVSCTIDKFGVALIRPASHKRTYPLKRATPCESMPRKSAAIKTLVAVDASFAEQPMAKKTDSVKLYNCW